MTREVGERAVPEELPELGPYLGYLTDVSRRFPADGLGLDEVRLTLVSELFDRTAAARQPPGSSTEPAARTGGGKDAWIEVWRAAVDQVAEQAFAGIEARFHAAALRSRLPDKRLRGRLPDQEDRAIFRHKLDAAGLDLEALALRLAAEPGPASPETIRHLGAELEMAWERLEAIVLRELEYWRPAIEQVAAWRRSPALLGLALAALLLAVGWLGLALGGFLPLPRPLQPLARWFWSLPWP